MTAHTSPETKIALAYILTLQEQGTAAQEILDSLELHEGVTYGFLDAAILSAANLLWPLHNPEQARAVLDDAMRRGDDARNHSLRTFFASIQGMAAEPAAMLDTMGAVDYDCLDDFGRVVGYAAETIALGDLGRVKDARARAAAGYRVLAESPSEDSFH